MGVGAGVALALVAHSHKRKLDGRCPMERYCPLGSKGEYDAAASAANWANVGFAVGAGALAAGLLLLLQAEPRAPSVALTPGPTPRGLSLEGRF